MSVAAGPVYRSVSEITGPSGWYTVQVNNQNALVYVNQVYDGGGWVMVLANRGNTGGMNNLTYNDAVNSCNYRTSGPIIGASGIGIGDLTNYNAFVGTSYWAALSGRVTSGKTTIVQFVSTVNGTALNATGSHNKRYRWRFDTFNGTYGMTGVTSIADETGTGSPGFYSYHAANGYSLTTFDVDQDVYGTNCSTMYNNNPWWYGSCWSGNYFAGGGYGDYPFWDGSGTDYWQYGAVYIK
jgi:hypothetical protein